MKRVPPRLYAILAREADYGVVFRRGPSRQVAVIGWNTNDDSFELGQWLKGRIYERRSDLSPDGRHLIFLAMDRLSYKGKRPWTAVSRVPFVTPLACFGWLDDWDGDGVFASNSDYWVRGKPKEEHLISSGDGLRKVQDIPLDLPTGFGADPSIYQSKLTRDGWHKVGAPYWGHKNPTLFRKPVEAGWWLEKSCYSGYRNGPNETSYWERHRLVGPDTEIDGADWEWADVDGRDVVYAARGALWRMRVGENSADTPRLLKDFTDMQFEARTAPYQGVLTAERGQ